jgi:hypothetical protein
MTEPHPLIRDIQFFVNHLAAAEAAQSANSEYRWWDDIETHAVELMRWVAEELKVEPQEAEVRSILVDNDLSDVAEDLLILKCET